MIWWYMVCYRIIWFATWHMVRHAMVWYGMAGFIVMWCGNIWGDMLWCDMSWDAMVWFRVWYMVWFEMLWSDVVGAMVYDVVWYGVIWHAIWYCIWYCHIWYGIIWHAPRSQEPCPLRGHLHAHAATAGAARMPGRAAQQSAWYGLASDLAHDVIWCGIIWPVLSAPVQNQADVVKQTRGLLQLVWLHVVICRVVEISGIYYGFLVFWMILKWFLIIPTRL